MQTVHRHCSYWRWNQTVDDDAWVDSLVGKFASRSLLVVGQDLTKVAIEQDPIQPKRLMIGEMELVLLEVIATASSDC